MKKALEDFDLGHAVEDCLGAGCVHRREESSRLRRVADPFALLGHEHVRVIEAGGRAVNAAEFFDCLERAGR